VISKLLNEELRDDDPRRVSPARSAEELTGTDAPLASALTDILTVTMQELIEAEVTARIGADHRERTPARTAQRNGHRPSCCRPRPGTGGPDLPQAAHRQLPSLSCSSGAGGSTRPCERDHDRLHDWHEHPEGRSAGQGARARDRRLQVLGEPDPQEGIDADVGCYAPAGSSVLTTSGLGFRPVPGPALASAAP
jgi:hypothetical protein